MIYLRVCRRQYKHRRVWQHWFWSRVIFVVLFLFLRRLLTTLSAFTVVSKENNISVTYRFLSLEIFQVILTNSALDSAERFRLLGQSRLSFAGIPFLSRAPSSVSPCLPPPVPLQRQLTPARWLNCQRR